MYYAWDWLVSGNPLLEIGDVIEFIERPGKGITQEAFETHFKNIYEYVLKVEKPHHFYTVTKVLNE